MANAIVLPELSFGSINKILNKENIDGVILQIMGYKKVPGQGTPRFRLLLNDGETLYPFAILATQLNHLIEDKQLEKFTILKLNKYVCTDVAPTKTVIICLEIESLLSGDQVKDQISLKKDSSQPGSISLISQNNNSQLIHNALPSTSYESQLISQDKTKLSQFTPNNIHKDNTFATQASTSNQVKRIGSEKINETSVSHNSMSTQTNLSISPCKNDRLMYSNVNISTHNKSPINQNSSSPSCFSIGTINQAGIVIPIINLTPYQSKWTVKARVVYKTSVVSYSNQRGNGKFFSFYLLDESAEIKAIAFNNQVDLHKHLEINRVYYVNGGNVKPSKENSLTKGDFEIMVTENTKIEPADQEEDIPFLKFNFMPIAEIKKLSKDNYADVVGICCSVSNLRAIASKVNDKEVYKVDLLLIDMDKDPITVSLWGSDAQEFKCQGNPIIVVRNARVTEFNGVSLSVSQSSMFFINPAVPEALELRSWFDNLGNSLSIKPLSVNERNSQSWKTFSDLAATKFEDTRQSEYFMLKGTIVMVNKERCMYRSCPREDCFKKVTESANGVFKCDKCDMEYDSYSWTLLLSLHLADFSDSQWAVAFRDVGEAIIGCSTKQLSKMKEENEEQYLETMSALHFRSFIFRLRSKMEVFNETSQLKTTVLEARPIEPVSYTNKLIADIRRMEQILNVD